jgi:LysM repeat protein
MKLKDQSNYRKKPSLKDRLTRRKTHRLAAHLTREEEWDYDAPNIKLSRAFVVVIILHIVAVGGILAFEVMKPDRQNFAELSDDDPEAMVKQEPMQLTNVIPSDVKIGDPSVAGYDHYIVKAGDSVASIADRHKVGIAELERLNRLDKGSKIYPGRNLFIPPHDDVSPQNVAQVVVGENLAAGSGGSLAAPPGQPREEVVTLPEEAREIASGPSPGIQRRFEREDIPEVVSPVNTPQPAATPPQPAATPPIEVAPQPTPQLLEATPPAPEPPRSEPAPPVPRTIPKPHVTPTAAERSGGTYVVAKGDNPWAIARNHGVSYTELIQANGIDDPTHLQIGAKLKIPAKR